MVKQLVVRFAAVGALAVICAGSAWTGAFAEKKDPAQIVESDALGGKERWLTHVSTDKPVYRPGEKVYVRAVTLNAATRAPLADEGGPAMMQIVGPKGEVVVTIHGATQIGVSGFAWQVPAGQAGGEYVARVSVGNAGAPPAERTFDVRTYRAPRLKTEITFLRDGYGPGDPVSATMEASRAEGGVPVGARVTMTALVDGREVHRSAGTIDGQGRCTARFSLPSLIERGEGTLAFTIEDGGVVETAAKTIPILLQTVDLVLYPEGGSLVAGIPCRVYFEARTPAKKPADISGVVEDAAGRRVAQFRTEHEGRGRFLFTPAKGAAYRLRVLAPAGISRTFALPEVSPEGTVLTAKKDHFQAGEPVVLQVSSAVQGPLTVTLSRREVRVASATIEGGKRYGVGISREVALSTAADGVLIATVWGPGGEPLAERLVYRQPAGAVNVRVEADPPRGVPGGKVRVTVTTTDAAGTPVDAVVGLTVTDDSVLRLIEKRERAPRLPVMVLLEPEVRELADAGVYLDAGDPKAPLALDLLLGTQGWRRFALVRVDDFVREHGDRARRVLAVKMPPPRPAVGEAWGGAMVPNDIAAVRAAVPMPAAPQKAAAEMKDGLEENERQQARDADKPAAMQPVVREPEGKFLAAPAGAKKKMEMADFREMSYVVVREYAHRARQGRRPGDRVDFAETLYWNAGVRTDATSGKASVEFDLNDAVTGFRLLADAFSAKGDLGAGEALVESVLPFYAEAKIPLEVTAGDRILLPVALVNGTSGRLRDAVVKIAAAPGVAVAHVAPVSLDAGDRVRRVVELAVGESGRSGDVVLDAVAGAYRDRVTRPLRVVPRGFPVEKGQGGVLTPGATLAFPVAIPKSRVPGSVRLDVTVYPSPLANLGEALERLMQEPNGCFEQTSSTTYPLVMAQQYFLTHAGVEPRTIERSRDLLDKGYARLTGFECKKQGYEWFGEDPGHEALTAYGLLEFTDMVRVRQVDTAMLARTRAWLLGTRDGKGGFSRGRRALHTWLTNPDASNAYISWALLAAGESPQSLAREVGAVIAAARASRDSYVIAVAANVARLAGEDAAAKALGDRLAALLAKEGYVDGAVTSIVGSGGVSLQVETTSYAILAWLGEPAHAAAVEKGMRWLTEVCKAGRYGSTQATVLALRAILAYDAARSRDRVPGTVQLLVDGKEAGAPVAFDGTTQGALDLAVGVKPLEPGDHRIEVRMAGGSQLPCSVTVVWADEQPDSSPACRVGLSVGLSADSVEEGGVVEAVANIENLEEDKVLPTPVAIIGIPGGLEVRHDQLKELVKSGTVAAYEVLGRDVVLYWRELQAGRKVRVPISLVAAVPGTYTGPASRAYLYYTDEQKTWAPPLAVKITAKK